MAVGGTYQFDGLLCHCRSFDMTTIDYKCCCVHVQILWWMVFISGGRWPGIQFGLCEIILLGYSIHYGALEDLFASKSECECVQRCSVCLRCEWLWVWSRVDMVVGTS